MSFSRSPKDLFSPAHLQELTAKVSDLELLLEMESQQKKEALTKVEALGERVRELELQPSQAHESHEALEKSQSSEQRAGELQMQLQSQAQQKHEATEKAELLDLRVADLERQLTEQSQDQDGAEKQVKVVLRDLTHRLSSVELGTDIQSLFCR